jgi:CRISPR/Cas system-associated exonuclease Cas4 (RecB family)
MYQTIMAGATPGSEYLQETLKNRILQDLGKLPSPSSSLLQVYTNISVRMMRFVKEQSPKIDKGIKVLGVEQELRFDTGKGYSLFGFADLIYERDGHVTIRDHKTGDKMWSKPDVRFHNQNFYYALIYFLSTDKVPRAEISFINTKEYVKKEPDVVYDLISTIYSKKELEIYYEQICKVIEGMLQSEAIPHYGKHCSYCPFQTPCFMERKGIDSTETVELNYTKRKARHGRFTEENTSENRTDPESSSLSVQW